MPNSDRKNPAICFTLVFALCVLLFPTHSAAIPAFSRQYQTSCSTCHVDFPKLNDFGKAFKDAGFKFPKDDESMLKIPPVLLGAPAQAELWPKTIFPGTIPGLPPIGLRFNSFFTVVGKNRGNFVGGVPGPEVPFTPRTDFEAGLFSIFTAGNFGSDIAFWVDEDFSVGGDATAGGLGDGYLKFVNIGRFLHLPKDSLHFRVGQFELELPFSQARSYNITPWDIYSEANIGVMNSAFPGLQNVNNAFALANASQGVEFSGGHHYGGYYYALAFVNQNTGQPIDTSGATVPSALGGFFSDANFKDIYGRLAYRFNLEHDAESRHAIQAAGPTGPRDHTYLNLGTFYFYGRSVQRASGVTGVVTAREPFYRVGGDFSFNYHNFNLYGLFMHGHDHNLLPITLGTGETIGFMRGVPATFSGGFLQADYLAYPWLMLIMRYDAVNSAADRINSAGLIEGGTSPDITPPFLFPFKNTRNRFTPGVQFLIHANIKASFEYQIRPQQSVTIDPTTHLPVLPFRTNTAMAAIEFVY